MSTSVNGFAPVIGAFYCIFDATQGSKVVCQVPDGAIIPTATSEVPKPLLDFDLVKNYLIPKAPLCNRLVTLRIGDYAVIGHPVNIVSDDYERNSFTYNFVFIFPTVRGSEPYESAITRLAKMTRALEEQSHYLSNRDNVYEIDSVLEQMFQDLNNFSECQIPFDRTNKVNIKLFPILEAPHTVRSFQVPVPTVRLSDVIDESWDPTMERILPYINGINSVRRIADLAEADYELTRHCIQHFIHYDCLVIIGLVQFSNIYAPTPEVATIATDHNLYQAMRAFVYHPAGNSQHGSLSGSVTDGSVSASASVGASTTTDHSTTPGSTASSELHRLPKITQVQAFHLFNAFHNGVTVYQWYNDHKELLQDVDIRRFLVFGVIRRLIARVHSYPIYDARGSRGKPPTTEVAIINALRAVGIAESRKAIAIIQRCFAAPVHFDELCTELRAPRSKVSKLLRSLGEWTIINR